MVISGSIFIWSRTMAVCALNRIHRHGSDVSIPQCCCRCECSLHQGYAGGGSFCSRRTNTSRGSPHATHTVPSSMTSMRRVPSSCLATWLCAMPVRWASSRWVSPARSRRPISSLANFLYASECRVTMDFPTFYLILFWNYDSVEESCKPLINRTKTKT